VVSFEVEGVRSYRGDYDRYLKQRAEEETVLEARARNLNREREQMERFVKRFRAQASKARLVQSRVKALEKMDEVQTLGSRRKISFRFPPCERTGRDVVTGENITKSYDELEVLSNVDVRLERGDRVAIVGANGAGKTTLLRILAGELDSTSGNIKLGHKVKLGYYAQHHVDVLSPTSTAFEEVQSAATSGSRKEIFSALGAMLFTEDDTDKRIGVLSGGERARVALARLLVDPGNVLLMDEPTNHLDLESSERLAEAMADYGGTLLFVSHNRGFVRRLAKTIWHVEDGRVEVYPGTLDEYITSMREKRSGTTAPPADHDQSAQAAAAPETPKAKRETRAEAKERKRREAEERNVLRPLRREVERLEKEIATLEEAQRTRTELLGDPAVYSDDVRRDELIATHEKDAKALERRTQEWMVAQETLDAAAERVR
jgi:ATP-binding cassette subfamily F protein 3